MRTQRTPCLRAWFIALNVDSWLQRDARGGASRGSTCCFSRPCAAVETSREGFLRRRVPVEGVRSRRRRRRRAGGRRWKPGAGEVAAVAPRRLPGRVLARARPVLASQPPARRQTARSLSRRRTAPTRHRLLRMGK